MKEREFERGQGCWNCVNSSNAVAFWTERRQADLQKVAAIATSSLLGEKDERVQKMIQFVDAADHYVAAHALLRCVKGIKADGQPVGDLVMHNFLCSKWTGKEGASLARIDGKLDKLPEELAWYVDGNIKPKSITQAMRDAAGDSGEGDK
jgi:hypothetical protein